MTKIPDASAQIYPVRYHADAHGRRVIFGLSGEETTEFERLQASGVAEADICGVGFARWSALYARHESAWRAWWSEHQLVNAT